MLLNSTLQNISDALSSPFLQVAQRQYLPTADSVDLTAGRYYSWITIAVLMLFILGELRTRQDRGAIRRRTHSYVVNANTFLLNGMLLSLLSVSSMSTFTAQYSLNGLLLLPDSFLLKSIIVFLSLDLTYYLLHTAMHRYNWLWLFHKVHHSDETMNTTTALRFHAGELILTALVKALFILVTGASAAMILICDCFIQLFVLFHHSDTGIRPHRAWAALLIVPETHLLHHSKERAEHDSNYGLVFSFWDRLFGTYRTGSPSSIGLKGVSNQSVIDLVCFGFTAQSPLTSERAGLPAECKIDGFTRECVATLNPCNWRAEAQGKMRTITPENAQRVTVSPLDIACRSQRLVGTAVVEGIRIGLLWHRCWHVQNRVWIDYWSAPRQRRVSANMTDPYCLNES